MLTMPEDTKRRGDALIAKKRQRITSAKINKAIRHLRLEIAYTRGDGYFYFISSITGEQIGDSVYVCHLNHLDLEDWVRAAEDRREQQANDQL